MKTKNEIIMEAFTANSEDFLTFQSKATERLSSPIEDTCGTYNKICTNCLERNGHPLNYYYQCGQPMVKYDRNVHGSITNREWIERSATSCSAMSERIKDVLIRQILDD
jgi:hypothetical protein